MTRALLLALCAAAVLPAAPAAASGPRWEGGCTYDFATTDLGAERTYTGVVTARVVLHPASPGAVPSAAVTCLTYRDHRGGAVIQSATFSGTGVVTGSEDETYTAPHDLPVVRCIEVLFDGETTPWSQCDDVHPGGPGTGVLNYVYYCGTYVERPRPSGHSDPIDATCAEVVWGTVVPFVDGLVCPYYAAVGQSGADVPGVLEVEDDGDVYAGGMWVWDCAV